MAGPRDDVEQAEATAEEEGTSVYEELENLGWTQGEIRDEFQDMYRDDPELNSFLAERDMSCTNEELGMNEDGTFEDEG